MKRSALLLALLLATGCQRKLPGPLECRTLAYRMFGVRMEQDLDDPRVRAKVDEQIHECLVTPYDYELVRCLEQGVRARVCQNAFVARRLGGDAPVERGTSRFR
ncbi:MAG TPA: hypothetical protein VNN72_01575 [Polyangiaceae bacterium]|nr:hypothetical protein [Polyangiaceae bacterium]